MRLRLSDVHQTWRPDGNKIRHVGLNAFSFLQGRKGIVYSYLLDWRSLFFWVKTSNKGTFSTDDTGFVESFWMFCFSQFDSEVCMFHLRKHLTLWLAMICCIRWLMTYQCFSHERFWTVLGSSDAATGLRLIWIRFNLMCSRHLIEKCGMPKKNRLESLVSCLERLFSTQLLTTEISKNVRG